MQTNNMYSCEMHTQVQAHPAPSFVCSDFSLTFAHAASFAVCAFFIAFAGDLLAASSFAAILLALSLILPIIMICIIICTLITGQHRPMRRE